MPAYVDTFNTIVSLGVVLLQICAFTLLLDLVFGRKHFKYVFGKSSKHAYTAGFLVALGSVCLSLFYSEVIGYTACELCWVQRFFIYPQTILFGFLLFKHYKKQVLDAVIFLSSFGTLVSLYHVYIEHGGSSSLACVTGASAVSCAARYVYEFGYITIPIMALTAQVVMLLIAIHLRHLHKQK